MRKGGKEGEKEVGVWKEGEKEEGEGGKERK